MTPRSANSLQPSLRRTAAALMLLAAGALASGEALAEEWTYTARKGDNLWVLADRFLVSMRHWPRFRSMNDVPNPRRMLPGTVIRFPARWLRVQPAPAVIVAISGSATRRGPDGAVSPAAPGDALGVGAAVVTTPGSSAVLRFADGSRMLVRPASEVRMDELRALGRGGLLVDSRARLQRGGVEMDVPAGKGSRMEITTPSASALVRGTRFRITSGPDASRAEVEEGVVRVGGARRSVDLAAGTGAVVREGEAPGRVLALLEAPDLARVPPLIERRQLRVRWPAVPRAVGYRAQLATTADIPTLLLDLPAATPDIELPDVPDGRYELRVRAVDEQGLEGRGSARVFELNARPEPPATLEPRPDATVRVTRPEFRWSEPVDAGSYRLQVARDPSFARLVMDLDGLSSTRIEAAEELVAGDYFWRVASVDGSGGQGPYGDAQPFTVRPAPPAPGEAEAALSEADVLLRWQAAQPGQVYEVELADSGEFGADARTVGTDTPSLTLPVPERDLWFRVRIVDTDGYRGPWGTPQRIAAPAAEPWWILAIPILIILL